MLLICLSFPLQDYEHLKGKDWDLLHFLLWHLVEIQKIAELYFMMIVMNIVATYSL